MKRLVQVLPHYSPPYVGGMEMRARDRAERLARDGWLVETITSAGLTYPHTAREGNLTVRYLRSRELAHTPVIFSLPLALLRIRRDSVLHVESALAFSPEVTALVARLRRMPYVLRVALDSAGHTRLRSRLLSWYQSVVLKRVYRYAAAVIVLTADDIDLVTGKYQVDPARVRVIPNATTFALADAPRTRPHEPFRLLFVGRVDAQKNVQLLLRALRRFIDSYRLPVRLELAGDGEELPAVKQLIADLSLTDYVHLSGFVTGADLERLYEQADALVLTSTREAFGTVILEAMTKGLPVVASDIRCVRTIIADGTTGFLAGLDEQSFADAFGRLLTQDGLYAKMSRACLEAARFYSMDAMIADYAALYEQILRTRLAPTDTSRPFS
jgi:glycosyltransferase involved in cell wall biosynthesis